MKPAKWQRNLGRHNCSVCNKEYMSVRLIMGEDVAALANSCPIVRWVAVAKEYLHVGGRYCIDQEYVYTKVQNQFTLRKGENDV